MKTSRTVCRIAKRVLFRGLTVTAAVLFAGMAVPAPGRAQPEVAPDFKATECIKADSLVLSEYFKHPVVLFFFDAVDASCFKAYNYTINWHAKYAADSVSVIGIHCPGYEAGRFWPNVITAVARTDLDFPIVMDYERKIYGDYGIETLPTLLLLEPGGRIVARASEESDYPAFEEEIHRVLRTIEPNVVLPFILKREKRGKFPPPTPKIDLGYSSGAIVNCDSTDLGEFRRYTDPGGKQPGKIYLDGLWKVGDGLLTYGEGEPAYIRVVYSGKDVWLLPYFSLDQEPRIYVIQDRGNLPLEVMGRDMKNDLETRTFIYMRHSVPLHLVGNPTYGTHELKIMPTEGVVSFEYLFFQGAD